MLVQHGITNIDDSLHFVTILLFISSLLNGGKMRGQIMRRLSVVAFAPSLYGTYASLLCLVRQDDMTSSSMHEVHNRSSLDEEARTYWGIHLRDNHDLLPIEHAQMTRLVKFMSNLLHDRQGFH